MALLVIVDTEGKEHLIHSSQIGPQGPRWQSPDEIAAQWRETWEKFDAENDSVPPSGPHPAKS